MVKFICNKLGRDKSLEGFKSESITPQYRILKGTELREALKQKLIEESNEVLDAKDDKEIIGEIADILEVIDGLYKAYQISAQEVEKIKKQKYNDRGGFENGLYIETLEMSENNPKINHFRKSPDKYPEV